MLKLKTKHFLTGTEIDQKELNNLIDFAITLKNETKNNQYKPLLKDQHLALLFDKPSLRTRFSFTVGMQQLGGKIIESIGSTRKTETPEDSIRVIQGYVDGLMYRTFSHDDLDKMSVVSTIPIINGLSDSHHPCQALADLLTLKEEFGDLKGKKLSYFGDGNNVLHSLLLLLPKAGVSVCYYCPKGYGPDEKIVKQAQAIADSLGQDAGKIIEAKNLAQACADTNAFYTDVWTSMGQEDTASARKEDFLEFQINETTLLAGNKDAIILHCMPMVRGEEISKNLPEHPQARIFSQCENRLHAQKALLVALMAKD